MVLVSVIGTGFQCEQVSNVLHSILLDEHVEKSVIDNFFYIFISVSYSQTTLKRTCAEHNCERRLT